MSDVIRQDARFFMVWNKAGGPPRVGHAKLATARAEANRLARLHPGHKFIVLQALEKHSVPPRPEAETCQPSEIGTV